MNKVDYAAFLFLIKMSMFITNSAHELFKTNCT